MTAFFLVALAIAWIAVFFPAVVRARRNSPLSASERFRRRMHLIAPRYGRAGRWVVVPESYDRLSRASHAKGQRRRKQILIGFVLAVALSGLGALVVGHAMWAVHLAFDASLGLYIALLIEAKRRRAERSTNVRSLIARRRLTTPISFEERLQVSAGRR